MSQGAADSVSVISLSLNSASYTVDKHALSFSLLLSFFLFSVCVSVSLPLLSHPTLPPSFTRTLSGCHTFVSVFSPVYLFLLLCLSLSTPPDLISSFYFSVVLFLSTSSPLSLSASPVRPSPPADTGRGSRAPPCGQSE